MSYFSFNYILLEDLKEDDIIYFELQEDNIIKSKIKYSDDLLFDIYEIFSWYFLLHSEDDLESQIISGLIDRIENCFQIFEHSSHLRNILYTIYSELILGKFKVGKKDIKKHKEININKINFPSDGFFPARETFNISTKDSLIEDKKAKNGLAGLYLWFLMKNNIPERASYGHTYKRFQELTGTGQLSNYCLKYDGKNKLDNLLKRPKITEPIVNQFLEQLEDIFNDFLSSETLFKLKAIEKIEGLYKKAIGSKPTKT